MATIDFAHSGGSFSGSWSGDTLGERITIDKQVEVTALRLTAPAEGNMRLSIFDSAGNRIADTGTFFKNVNSSFVERTLLAPVTLLAGVEYVLAVYRTSSANAVTYLTSTSPGASHTHSGSGATITRLGERSRRLLDSDGFPSAEMTASGFYEVRFGIVGSFNTPPNAPTLTAPANGATIDRNSIQRFALTPSDPDAGDSTSKTDWRYRLVGAATWTDVSQALPQTYTDFAAGTFGSGEYEWQARTYDSLGIAGPYSGSSFFTAAIAPETPTITAPINGATVSNTATVTWSTPDQDAYQVRRVADVAGSPDTGAVYFDSAEVVTVAARSRDLTFDTNNRYEHVQVRQKRGGLWSQWASVRVLVSFTPPPVPVVTLTANTPTLIVTVTNPTPGAGEPTVLANDVFVTEDGHEERRAAVTPNGSWTYWLPKAGLDYDQLVRVEAIGDNGTRSSS